MAMRVHYKFSQETLSYVKVQRSVFHRFFGNHPLLAVGVVLVLFFGMSFLVPSRAERVITSYSIHYTKLYELSARHWVSALATNRARW